MTVATVVAASAGSTSSGVARPATTSIANTTAAMGVLYAAANPAAVPAAISLRRASAAAEVCGASAEPAAAPTCKSGPSRPSEPPVEIALKVAAASTSVARSGIRLAVRHGGDDLSCPRSTANARRQSGREGAPRGRDQQARQDGQRRESADDVRMTVSPREQRLVRRAKRHRKSPRHRAGDQVGRAGSKRRNEAGGRHRDARVGRARMLAPSRFESRPTQRAATLLSPHSPAALRISASGNRASPALLPSSSESCAKVCAFR